MTTVIHLKILSHEITKKNVILVIMDFAVFPQTVFQFKTHSVPSNAAFPPQHSFRCENVDVVFKMFLLQKSVSTAFIDTLYFVVNTLIYVS